METVGGEIYNEYGEPPAHYGLFLSRCYVAADFVRVPCQLRR
jgi:hypothetical protein